MSFGSNLQFMRKMHNGMTQEELAEKMGVSRQTVSKWEMDGAFPEMEKAIVLSRLFNCSLDELLKEDLNSENKAYHHLRVEEVGEFQYVSYAVISEMPEEDAKKTHDKLGHEDGNRKTGHHRVGFSACFPGADQCLPHAWILRGMYCSGRSSREMQGFGDSTMCQICSDND